MLDGQGADEFLGGYLPFYNYSLLRKYKIPSLLNNHIIRKITLPQNII